jgi:nitrite reductase/ring-hydroxylating ferredoxin subunit
MQNHKVLYQFGKYLFNRENLSVSVGINARTQIEDTAFGDGSVRVNGIKRDYKGDYILTASFLGKENDDLNLFNFLVLNEPQQIFFTSVSKNIQGEESVKVYWNYASYVSMTQGISSGDNEDVVNYEINFRMFTPYFYECTKDVDLIVPEKRVNLDLDWNKFVWNDSTAWNDVNDSQLIPLANYTNQEQVDLIGCCKSKYRLNYVDRYWKTNNKAPKSRNLLRSTDDLSFCIIQPSRTQAKWNQFNWGSAYWEPPNCNTQQSVSGENWNSFDWNDNTLWATINDSTATVSCEPTCINAWKAVCDGYWNAPVMAWNNFYWRVMQDLGTTAEIINGLSSIVNTQILCPNAQFYQTIQSNVKGQDLTGGFWARGNGDVRIGFREYDISGTMVADSYDNFTLTEASFQLLSVTKKIGASTAKLDFYWFNIIATPLTISIANLQVNVGAKLLDYEPNMQYDRYDIDLSQSLPILTKNGTQTVKTREIVGSAIDQQFVQIRIPKMELGEYHTIYNKSNNTGYKISWLSQTTIDNAMILNCSKGQLFDVSTGAEINPEKGKVKLEIFGIKNLKLTPNLSPPDEFWETNTNTLEISSSTQKQQIIYLTNLNTYH